MYEHIKCAFEKMGEAIVGLANSINELSEKQKYVNDLCEKYTHEQLAKMYVEKEQAFDQLSTEVDRYKKECEKLESELAVKENLLKIKAGIETDYDMEYTKLRIAELEDRHQSDCITINQLNTTIDVLVDKLNILRKLNGL